MFRLLYVGQNPTRLAGQEGTGTRPSDLAVCFANTIEEAVAQASHSDVVLVSATLPGEGALQVIHALTAAQPRIRILVQDLADAHQVAQPFIDAGAMGWTL